MYAKALEILAIKLAQAELDLALAKAELEQTRAQLEDVIRNSTSNKEIE